MPVIARSTLDAILTIQLNLAWAGEWDCDPKRMGWWRANLSEPANGGDFLASLAPTTWKWSALIALRQAGRRADVTRSGEDKRSDRYSSIFRIAPLVDEKLDERLRDLRHAGRPPHHALPDLLFRLSSQDDDSAFDSRAFSEWLESLADAEHTLTPTGLHLDGDTPRDPLLRVRKLARLLVGLPAGAWPHPHVTVNT